MRPLPMLDQIAPPAPTWNQQQDSFVSLLAGDQSSLSKMLASLDSQQQQYSSGLSAADSSIAALSSGVDALLQTFDAISSGIDAIDLGATVKAYDGFLAAYESGIDNYSPSVGDAAAQFLQTLGNTIAQMFVSFSSEVLSEVSDLVTPLESEIQNILSLSGFFGFEDG